LARCPLNLAIEACTYILNSFEIMITGKRKDTKKIELHAYLHHFQKGLEIWREFSIYFNYPLESIKAISVCRAPMAPSMFREQ